jgi:hypothetical protein
MRYILSPTDFSENSWNAIVYALNILTNMNVEDIVQCFVESRSVDMIAIVTKNLNYFQQILFHSKVEKINYHSDGPFLVIHQ